MPKVGDGQLSDGTFVIVEDDPPVEDARGLVDAGNALQFDSSPGRCRRRGNLVEQPLGPSSQGDERDLHPVQFVEIRISCQLGIEDQFLGKATGPLLPELDEAKDLIVLLVLAQLAVGVAEDAGVGVLGQERQHTLLPSASLGDVVLLDQGVVAVERGWCGSRGRTMFPISGPTGRPSRTSRASAWGNRTTRPGYCIRSRTTAWEPRSSRRRGPVPRRAPNS